MAPLLDEVSLCARFPEFGEQQPAVINSMIAKAERDTPADVWSNPDIRIDAVAYLTAHLLASRISQIGMQVGQISGQPTGMGYDSTLYGQEYKRMRDTLPVMGFAHVGEASLFY